MPEALEGNPDFFFRIKTKKDVGKRSKATKINI